jgi:hypothetical protein
MKKLIPLALVALFFSFTACDDIVPDIEKEIVESYTVTIDAETPSHVGDTVYIDIEEFEEFADFEQYVNGYALNKITYEIVEFDASENLYFSGVIMANDSAMSETITVGSISTTNMNDLFTIGEVQTMEQEEGASEQLVAWLDDPGNFYVVYDFAFENEDGTDHVFTEEEYGSTIKIKVSFHLTIMTGGFDTGGFDTGGLGF